MKKTLLLLVIFCKINISSAQPAKPIYKVVPVITSQSFYLKGGSRAVGANSSRQVLPIELPANTIEWFYSVTTTPNRKESLNSNLTAQLDKLIVPDLGISAKASS